MPKFSRDKGRRGELDIIHKLAALGIKTKRVGVAYQKGHDLDAYIFGEDFGALVCEVKSRATMPAMLGRWLNQNDMLFIRPDRCDPVVVMPWRVFEQFIGRVK